MRAMVRTIGLVTALVAGSLLSGCARSIHIEGLGDIRKQNVRVDVVGVNWVEKQQWEALSMQDYWSEGNQLRKDAIDQKYNLPVTFSPGKLCAVTIRGKDPHWKNWTRRKATHFLVMFDTCSDNQAWRLCLPLSTKCWSSRTIEISIQPSGVVPKTAPKPKCKG